VIFDSWGGKWLFLLDLFIDTNINTIVDFVNQYELNSVL
jgi:hypothetical protein